MYVHEQCAHLRLLCTSAPPTTVPGTDPNFVFLYSLLLFFLGRKDEYPTQSL